jgi:tripartite-type tricarboxylate transporter receptor subunit TctC
MTQGRTMKLPRRQFLHLAAGVAALPAVSRLADAQTFPAKPARLVVGYAAGGVNDILARLMGQWLSTRLGQPFIIENKPGAGGNIGTEAVVRAPDDGYSLLLIATANAINATLYERLNFNFIHDIAPVAGIGRVSNVMVVHPSFPAKTLPEFIDYAKANPGKITMASAGIGTPQHVGGELFKMMTGVNMVHVPYRGGAPALTDVIGGQVQIYFASMASSIEYIKAGKVRPLAVTSTERSEALPDTPPISDFVPGYEASAWYGVGAPRNTPTEIIEKLNKEINAGLADPKLKGRLIELGALPLTGSPSEFGKLLADETEKWGKVVKFASIKPE